MKPENIHLGGHGEVLVCDWGNAEIICSADNSSNESLLKADILNPEKSSTYIRGTLGYISPKRYHPQHFVCPQDDLYSLGIILFECLSLKAVSEDAHHDIFYSSNLTPALKAICHKAISQTTPYSQVNDLKDDLLRYLNGYAPMAHHISYFSHFVLFIKRHPIALTIATGALLSITILSFFYSILIKQSEQEAISEKLKANLALKQFKEEKRISDELRLSLQRETIQDAKLFISRGFYNNYRTVQANMRSTLNRLMTMNQLYPNNYEILNTLGDFHFLLQRFDKAINFYKKIPDYNSSYLEISHQYKSLIGNHQLLSLEDLFKLCVYERKRDKIDYSYEKIIYYDYSVRQFEEDSKGLRPYALLKLYNPNWSNIKFEYKHTEQALILGGDQLERFKPIKKQGSRKNALTMIPLRQLSLYNTSKLKVSELNQLKLDLLDITQANIEFDNIEFLYESVNLKTIKMSPEQFKDNKEKFNLFPIKIIIQQ